MMTNNRMHNHTKSGFVLVSVFMMMGIASLIVMQLCTRGAIYNLFVPIMYEREQARFLALSGITCALNQLAMKDDSVLKKENEKKSDKKGEKPDPKERKQDFFLTLLMIQNKWQKYEIKDEGYEGEFGIYVSCEDGKIPVNGLMDFTKQTFVTLQKPALFKGQDCVEWLGKKLEENKKSKDPFPHLKTALKERKYAFTAVEELLSIEGLQGFKDSVYPPFPSDERSLSRRSTGVGGKPQLYLQDIFTMHVVDPVLNPWFFTSSLKMLCEIKEEKKMDLKEYEKIVKSLDFSKTALSQEWDKSLKKVYNKSYTALPDKIVGLLTAKFEPRFFSMLCYGKVGNSEQRLCAYVERLWTEDTETFKVHKIYWL